MDRRPRALGRACVRGGRPGFGGFRLDRLGIKIAHEFSPSPLVRYAVDCAHTAVRLERFATDRIAISA